jgi:hypothetical protein
MKNEDRETRIKEDPKQGHYDPKMFLGDQGQKRVKTTTSI